MNANLSRRQLLKNSGALVVSFSLYGPLSRAFGQSQQAPEARPLAVDRVLSARGLDQLRAELRAAETALADSDSAAAAAAVRSYGRLRRQRDRSW